MRYLGLAAFLLGVEAWSQDSPSVDEVIAKIEERAKPIKAVTATLRFTEMPQKMSNSSVALAGQFVCEPGQFLHRTLEFAAQGEGMLHLQDYYSAKAAGTKSVFTAGHEMAAFQAVKFDPAKPQAGGGGIGEMISTMLGFDGYLLDVALYPRRLRVVHPDLQAKRMKLGDKDCVALTARRSADLFGFGGGTATLTWYFDAANYRVEKFELDTEEMKGSTICQGYVAVNGVDVPNKVVYNLDRGFEPDGGKFAVTFELAASGDAKLPAWLNDAAIPAPSEEALESLLERSKKDPKNASLALSCVNAVWKNPAGISPQQVQKAIRDVAAALQGALAGQPDSGLLVEALYCAGQVTQDEDGAKKLIDQIVQKKLDCDEVLLMEAFGRLGKGKFKEALELIGSIGVDPIHADAVASIRLQCRAADCQAAKDLSKLIEEECKDKDPTRRVRTIDMLEPASGARGPKQAGILREKSDKFVEELAADPSPEIQLLAARGYAGRAQSKSAAGLYAKLAAQAEYRAAIKSELEAFCKSAKDDAAAIVDVMLGDFTDAEFLVTLADGYFDKKADDKFKKVVSRTLEVLAQEKKEASSRRYGYRDAETFKALTKKLVEANRGGEIKALLLAYVNGNNVHTLRRENGLILKVLGDDKEAAVDLYKVASGGGIGTEELGLEHKDILGILKQRIDRQKFDEADVRALGVLAGDKELSRELIAYLEKGVNAFPSPADLHEKLADAYVYAEEFAKAIAEYKEVLSKKVGGRRMSMTVPVDVSNRSVPVEGDGKYRFNCSSPTIVKMIYAHVKNKDREGGMKAVEQYLKDLPGDDAKEKAIEAYGVLELPEKAFALKKSIFLSRVHPKQPEGRPRWPGQSSDIVPLGVELAQRYLKDKKYEEAYAVLRITQEELEKDGNGSEERAKNVEELRTQLQAAFGEDDLIRTLCDSKLPAMSDEQSKKVTDLVGKLDEDDPAVREGAMKQLRELGAAAAPRLRDLLKDQGPEPAKRIRGLLVELADQALRAKFEKD